MIKSILKYIFEKTNISEVFMSYNAANIYDISNYGNVLLDARSATYAATGYIEITNNPAILICMGDNESRSCYSGLTEAHYKKLPLIFLSVINDYSLSYRIEIKDTVYKTIDLSNVIDLEKILQSIFAASQIAKSESLPVHVIVKCPKNVQKHSFDKIVKQIIDMGPNNYVFVGNQIWKEGAFNAKHNAAGFGYGVLSNVLGASFCNRFEKYIGICTETEFVLDINALGNRHIDDNISFCVFAKEKKHYIRDYATSCGFLVFDGIDKLSNIIKNKKSIIILEEEW